MADRRVNRVYLSGALNMLQDRLNSLYLMSIESELLKEMDFDDVINDFILAKRRKINF